MQQLHELMGCWENREGWTGSQSTCKGKKGEGLVKRRKGRDNIWEENLLEMWRRRKTLNTCPLGPLITTSPSHILSPPGRLGDTCLGRGRGIGSAFLALPACAASCASCKKSWRPLRDQKKMLKNMGLLHSKWSARSHGFNEANGKLIQVQESEILPKKCWNLTVWFGSTHNCQISALFWPISRTPELGSIYRLLRWNRVT